MSNDKVVVVFAKSWRGYSKGEKAGFDEAQAKALVDGEVAELAKGGKAPARPAAPKPAAAKAGAKPTGVDVPAAGGDEGQDQSGGEAQDAGGAEQSGADDDEPKP